MRIQVRPRKLVEQARVHHRTGLESVVVAREADVDVGPGLSNIISEVRSINPRSPQDRVRYFGIVMHKQEPCIHADQLAGGLEEPTPRASQHGVPVETLAATAYAA